MRKKIIKTGLACVLSMSMGLGVNCSINSVAADNEIVDCVGSESLKNGEVISVAARKTIAASAVDKIASIHNPIINYTTNEVTYSYVYFGSYPQSEVTGDALTEEIIGADYASSKVVLKQTNIKDITNYSVSGEAVVMGEKYRRMAGEDGSYRYFKYEPIKWRVMSVEDNVAELLADVVLDSRKYTDESAEYVEEAVLAEWLNGENMEDETFVDCAFTRDEVRSITRTGAKSVIDSKVYLWKYRSEFTDSGIMSKASDYAWCRGIMNGDKSIEYVDWWTDYNMIHYGGYVNRKGEFCDKKIYEDYGGDYEHLMYRTDRDGVGVRPALNLDLTQTNYWYTEDEFNVSQEVVDYNISDIRNYKNDMQVLCQIPTDCCLVVEGYNEQGELEAYGETVLNKGATRAYVSVNGFKEKGTYLVKASLMDKDNGQLLCESFSKALSDIGIRELGQCGENVFYTWDYEGNVEIYGQGKMYDYSNYTNLVPVLSPFYSNQAIKTIKIENGITYIGNHAFEGLGKLEKIEFADSVAEIGEYAFYVCNSLEKIGLPKGLKVIDNYAFRSCSKLKEVTMSEGLESLGDWVFYECNSLDNVQIPDSVTTMGKNIFGKCVALKSVILPKCLQSIDEDALYGMEDTTLIYVHKGSYGEEYMCSIGRAYAYIDDEGNKDDNIIIPPVVSREPVGTNSPMPSEKPNNTIEPLVSEFPSDKPISTYEKGDVDMDGKVTLSDAQLTLKSALKIVQLSEIQENYADMNSDGVVDLSDAQKVLKKALKIE